jgi:hypothetical protein
MTGTAITAISREGRPVTAPLDFFLSLEQREAVRVEANAWIKRLRAVPYGGLSMRDRFIYRGDSLWWFTELYLHKTRAFERALSAILALESARERHDPARLAIESSDRWIREAGRAFGATYRLPIDVRGQSASPRRAWSSYVIGLTARLPRWRPAQRSASSERPAVAAFVHTAFWRPGDDEAGGRQETYIGPVLDAIVQRLGADGVRYIGVGPRRNFRARRWWDPIVGAGTAHAHITPVERFAPSRALEGSIGLWRRRDELARELATGDAIRAAAVVRGCDLWPIVRAELGEVARLQWPWSARAMDEAAASLDATSPRLVLTYAEAGGWGRALVLEARRRGIPSVGLQHGFIYRHWLNYLHEPDEIGATERTPGCPIPTRTLVFDEFTRAHLVETGRFPDAAVTVTGSARLEDLAARVTAAQTSHHAVRASLLSEGEERLAVLAAKRSELGPVLGDLIDAVRPLSTVRLVIKPHPAETADVYREAAGSVRNVSIAPAETDLARLLAAADALVTMNSTVAIDGLALGVPALVVGLPNNLSPFVEAGVMLGANGPAAIRTELRSVLYDAGVRHSLAEAARRFTDRFDMRAGRGAAERAAAEVFALIPAG